MRHGSLFSGIGGFDLAAEWMGWENMFHCEWYEFGQKILKHYWPKAVSYGDITKTDFTIWRGRIDILTGGFPCQPYSTAGKRKGKEDDRHLWPEMLRAIREIQPRYVVGENVRGLTNWNGGLVFDEVQADLEAQGYEVLPFLLPACAVNAPHRRDRIWFVAYYAGQRCGEKGNGEYGPSKWSTRIGRKRTITHSRSNGYSDRFAEIRCQTEEIEGAQQWEERNQIFGKRSRNHPERIDVKGYTAHSNRSGLQRRPELGGIRSVWPHRKEQFNGFFSRTAWDRWPTVEPLFYIGNDGLSSKLDGITVPKWRNESLKGAGNAIVPQVAYQIFKSIQQSLF